MILLLPWQHNEITQANIGHRYQAVGLNEYLPKNTFYIHVYLVWGQSSLVGVDGRTIGRGQGWSITFIIAILCKPHDLTLSLALISAPLSSRATTVSVWPFSDEM